MEKNNDYTTNTYSKGLIFTPLTLVPLLDDKSWTLMDISMSLFPCCSFDALRRFLL